MRQVRSLRNKEQILTAIDTADSVLIVAHASPDGDAVGSLLACGRILTARGKRVIMALPDPVPAKLAFLSGADRVVLPEALVGKRFDLGIALDCADARRMGACSEAFFACGDTIQLDHHARNPGFARLNEVDEKASSTGCVLWRLTGAMGIMADRETAECIYCAISTDTGNFRFPCTDEETFLCAAEMISTGFDLGAAARKIHLIKEKPHVRLLGRAIASMRFFAGGECSSMLLTEEDYLFCDAKPEHSECIVNTGLNLPDVKMTYLMDLREKGTVKLSFRAVEPCQVLDIAVKCGGGGHALASGCRMEGDPDEIRSMIEAEMCRQIESMKK